MSILRVSTTSNGQQANGESYFPSLSENGLFVAFQSLANNLVSGDTNGALDIFVKNLETGLVTLASTTATGALSNNVSYYPSISGNGRLVAFQSSGTNLVTGDTNGQSDIFVKDLQTGTLTRVSTTSSGGQARGISHAVDISEDGGAVAFVSRASNLVAGDTNGVPDIFVKYLATGRIVCASTTESGAPANGTSDYNARQHPVLSSDASCVAFASLASNLCSGDGSGWDIFIKNLSTGKVALASIAQGNGAPANGDSHDPAMSADGRYVAFTSTASNLVSGDVNGQADVFVKDMLTGKVETISNAWASDTGPGFSDHAAISDDGRYVAFTRFELKGSDADIYLKDRLTGELTLLNTTDAGDPSNKESKYPDVSMEGGRLVFVSYSTDLVQGDTNKRADVFLTTLPHATDPDPVTPITGDSRPNNMFGTNDNDLIRGLGDNDTLLGGAGDDTLEGGDGNDRLIGDDGDDVFSGDDGDDSFFGGVGNDSLLGGAGDDSLHGGIGADTVEGGDGNDTLNGFKETDILIGGAGADVFLFKGASEHSQFGAGDTIEDFQTGIDRIDLRDLHVDAFAGTGGFVAHDGNIEVRFDPATHQLQADMNDNGRFDAGDLEINGITAIVAHDLLL